MRVPFHQVDTFTSEPFRGNPAGVCQLTAWPTDDVLRTIAAEINASETAFVVEEGDALRLRWFTPEVEVPLCGHGTLAAGHVLFASGVVGPLQFETRSGTLTVARDGARMVLDLPALPAAPCDVLGSVLGNVLGEVSAALGVAPRLCLANERSLVAVLDTAAQVRDLAPDMAAVSRLDRPYLIATAVGDGAGCDFVSRFFAPRVGVPEDPVTGSAHCVLTPYWAARLGGGTLHARQISARGGDLWCTARGDRVLLAGHAVTIVEGTLLLPPTAAPPT